MIKTVLAAVGSVGAAFASALCCAGPLIAVSLGMSAAGFASTFEPLRPYLLAAPVCFWGRGSFCCAVRSAGHASRASRARIAAPVVA